jgi:hypothetical protein
LQAICVIVAWEIGLVRDEIGGVKTAGNLEGSDVK